MNVRKVGLKVGLKQAKSYSNVCFEKYKGYLSMNRKGCKGKRTWQTKNRVFEVKLS